MYRFLVLLLVLSAMEYFTWAFENYYDGPTEEPHDHQHFGYHGHGHNEYHVDNVHASRHPHRHTTVETPKSQRLNYEPTTVKNYIETASSNTNNYFNTSENHSSNIKINNKRKSQADEDRMIYPTDMEDLSNHVKSRSCSFGLCDEVDNYPVDKIERILKQSELKKFFLSEVQLGNRFGEKDEGENLCATITHTRFPKTAKNMQDKEQVIVNVDQYKQGVVFETCKDEGPCSFSENFPNNFTPKCVQKYTVRKLMVVGKESDDTIFDDFKIPSCCVCMVKK